MLSEQLHPPLTARGLVYGTAKVAELMRGNQDDGAFSGMTLSFLGMAFPDHMKSFREAFSEASRLTTFGVGLNDWVDMRDSPQADSQAWIRLVSSHTAAVEGSFAERGVAGVRDYGRETNIVEAHTRGRLGRGEGLVLADIDQYRAHLNAICVTQIAAAILPVAAISESRLQPIGLGEDDVYHASDIDEKYRWIYSEVEPLGLTVEEARLRALHALVMGLQYIDDRHDRDADERLGMPTLAGWNVGGEHPHRVSVEDSTLLAREGEYFDRARRLGASRRLVLTVKHAFGTFKRMQDLRMLQGQREAMDAS